MTFFLQKYQVDYRFWKKKIPPLLTTIYDKLFRFRIVGNDDRNKLYRSYNTYGFDDGQAVHFFSSDINSTFSGVFFLSVTIASRWKQYYTLKNKMPKEIKTNCRLTAAKIIIIPKEFFTRRIRLMHGPCDWTFWRCQIIRFYSDRSPGGQTSHSPL